MNVHRLSCVSQRSVYQSSVYLLPPLKAKHRILSVEIRSLLIWKDTLRIHLGRFLRGDCSVELLAHPGLIGSQGFIVAIKWSGNHSAISACGIYSCKPFIRWGYCHWPAFYRPTAPKPHLKQTRLLTLQSSSSATKGCCWHDMKAFSFSCYIMHGKKVCVWSPWCRCLKTVCLRLEDKHQIRSVKVLSNCINENWLACSNVKVSWFWCSVNYKSRFYPLSNAQQQACTSIADGGLGGHMNYGRDERLPGTAVSREGTGLASVCQYWSEILQAQSPLWHIRSSLRAWSSCTNKGSDARKYTL